MTPRRAAILAANLPDRAAIWAAVGSPKEWAPADYLLSSIDYSNRVAVWMKTKDGQNNRKPPEPAETPADRARQEQRNSRAEVMARRFKERHK